MTTPTVAFILKGYPRLSETFIAQEIHGLERRGLDIRLFSMRLPTDPAVHPVHRQIRAPVVYLPEYLHRAPLRVIRAWWRVRSLPGYAPAKRRWLADLRRSPTRDRVRRFGQALVLADELPQEVAWLHAHFLHTPASTTRYAAAIRGLPFSISAHAKDIWTIPAWDARDKLADCRWLVTCTATHAEHLSRLAPHPERVSLVYHGLDFDRFPPPQSPRPPRTGQSPSDPIAILSVGRLVPKKGYDTLIHALALLPADLHWRFVHIGGGQLKDSLHRLATQLGLDARVTWLGAQPQEKVIDAYRSADLFVLACRIADDGDRDGLPNVLMEAQSQQLACLTTTLPTISELIEDGKTGVLVPPSDAAALAAALVRLARSPDLRRHLANAALIRLQTTFSYHRGVDDLADRFGIPEEPAEPETNREPQRLCASISMPR